MEIKDHLGAGEAITKLMDTVKNTIGGFFDPINIRRIAKAKGDEIRIIGEEIRKNSDLSIKYENDGITIDTTDLQEIMKRSTQRQLF